MNIPTPHMELPFQTNAKLQMIIFIGIQASGKTTFYTSVLACHGLAHINLDTLHSRHKEAIAIRACLDSGKSFVIDNTNPQIADRQRYISLAKKYGYEIIGIFFQSRVQDCIKRNEQRGHSVPRCAIPSTSNKLQMPSYDEGFDQLFFARIVNSDFAITKWKE